MIQQLFSWRLHCESSTRRAVPHVLSLSVTLHLHYSAFFLKEISTCQFKVVIGFVSLEQGFLLQSEH